MNRDSDRSPRPVVLSLVPAIADPATAVRPDRVSAARARIADGLLRARGRAARPRRGAHRRAGRHALGRSSTGGAALRAFLLDCARHGRACPHLHSLRTDRRRERAARRVRRRVRRFVRPRRPALRRPRRVRSRRPRPLRQSRSPAHPRRHARVGEGPRLGRGAAHRGARRRSALRCEAGRAAGRGDVAAHALRQRDPGARLAAPAGLGRRLRGAAGPDAGPAAAARAAPARAPRHRRPARGRRRARDPQSARRHLLSGAGAAHALRAARRSRRVRARVILDEVDRARPHRHQPAASSRARPSRSCGRRSCPRRSSACSRSRPSAWPRRT